MVKMRMNVEDEISEDEISKEENGEDESWQVFPFIMSEEC